MSTKIDWTDMTWNPVWGCENNCPYCYARGMAKRFGTNMAMMETKYRYENNRYPKCDPHKNYKYQKRYEDLVAFKPIWLQKNFDKKFPKKPSRIFVNSMSDVAFWRPNWMAYVLKRIKEYPQHTFQLLTKNPEVYLEYDFPSNCWLGVTLSDPNEHNLIPWGLFVGIPNLIFLSIEPMQKPLEELRYLKDYGWIIIGAETGNRKGKVIPERKWIEDIVNHCKRSKIPVFLKDNLLDIWEGDLIQEFPEVTK